MNFCRHKNEMLTENYSYVAEYIANNYMHYQTSHLNKKYTSYGIKHIIENELGATISNLDVKVAMESMGIKSSNKKHKNLFYAISKKVL